jgi:hypothetical protein
MRERGKDRGVGWGRWKRSEEKGSGKDGRMKND